MSGGAFLVASFRGKKISNLPTVYVGCWTEVRGSRTVWSGPKSSIPHHHTSEY